MGGGGGLGGRAGGHETGGPELLRLDGIWKAYGPVLAVRDVTFALRAGEVRALLGENGAGKTTLMNILYGLVRPDTGRIVVDGEDVTPHWSARQAIGRGVGMVHQHFSLVGEHTVLENVVMPALRWGELRPDWRRHRAAVERLAAEHGFGLPPGARVDELTVGQRQQVEILKVLYQGARVLILDEPTSVLTPQQTETLLEMLRRLGERGHAVVLITHKLREALAASTGITVLRQGAHVATVGREAATPADIARLMVNQDWTPARQPAAASGEAVALAARELTVAGPAGRAVERISLDVRAGEILGVAGVAGNGQSELAEALVGYRRPAGGRVRVGDVDVTERSIGERRRLGLAFIPEDRHALGAVLDMTIAQNLILGRAGDPPFSRRGVLRQDAIRAHADAQRRAFDIRAPSVEAPMGTLSGGNQQKVVLSRALAGDPRAIVACEPTRGLDFGATEYVRGKLVDAAARGVGVLLVSSDLEELMEVCHRIVVMFRGAIVGDLRHDEYAPHRLGLLMAGVAA